jgi:hypothetical protein
MGLLLDPTCAASGIEEDLIWFEFFYIEEELALHFICICLILENLRTQIFGKPILSVGEYDEMSAGSFAQFAEKSGRFETRVQLNFN